MIDRVLRVKNKISFFRKCRFVISVKYNFILVSNKIHIQKIQTIIFSHFKRELKAFVERVFKIFNILIKLSGATNKISSTYLT